MANASDWENFSYERSGDLWTVYVKKSLMRPGGIGAPVTVSEVNAWLAREHQPLLDEAIERTEASFPGARSIYLSIENLAALQYATPIRASPSTVMIDAAPVFSGPFREACAYACALPSLAGVSIITDEGEVITWRDVEALCEDAE
jgi:hypothetical protein